MGQRSATETVAGIFQRFLQQREWSQAALARSLEISVKAVRARLAELEAEGIPFERIEAPPHVLWRVPDGWFPGSLQLNPREIGAVLQQLLQAPESDARNALIDRIVAAAPRKVGLTAARSAIGAPQRSREDSAWLPLVMDAAIGRKCLLIRYESASTGSASWRSVSPQRAEPGPPARFFAWCHESLALRWFRVDRIVHGHVDGSTAFVEVDPAQVAQALAESFDGYRQTESVRCVFAVRSPEARWVKSSLPGQGREKFVVEEAADGVRVTLLTSAVVPLARYVVGLGEAARAETPELRAEVERLARGALHGADRSDVQ